MRYFRVRLHQFPLAVLLVFALLLSGCGGDRSPALVPVSQDARARVPKGDPIARATIGTAGGSLSGGGFTLTVPASVFTTNQTLSLYQEARTGSSAGGCVSDTFTVTGLPKVVRRALSASIKPLAGETTSGFSFLSMGDGSFAPSSGASDGTRVLTAKIAPGKLVAAIPAAPPLTTGSADGAVDTSQTNTASVRLSAFSRWRALNSSMNHFRVIFHTASCSEACAALIAEDAETAYRLIENQWGFSWARRTAWPVDIQVNGDVEGIAAFVASRWSGMNGGSLEVNSANTGSEAEVRQIGPAVEHEVFHLAQSLYETRNRWSAATGAGPWYWFDEATATEFEYHRGRQLVGPSDPLPVPDTTQTYQAFAVQHGLEFPSGNPLDVRHHGYGAAAFLNTAVPWMSTAGIGGIYADHYANPSRSPVQGIANQLGSSTVLEQVFEDFVDNWALGKVFAGQDFPTDSDVLASRVNAPKLGPGKLSVSFVRPMGDLSIWPIIIGRSDLSLPVKGVGVLASITGLSASDRTPLLYRVSRGGGSSTITKIRTVQTYPLRIANFEEGAATLLVLVNHSARMPYLSQPKVRVSLQLQPAIDSVSPTGGGEGTTVTIEGYGFGTTQGSAKIKAFGWGGSVDLTPTSWTNTSIRFVMPKLSAPTGSILIAVDMPCAVQPDWNNVGASHGFNYTAS